MLFRNWISPPADCTQRPWERSRSRCHWCCHQWCSEHGHAHGGPDAVTSGAQSMVTLTVQLMLQAQWRSEHGHAYGATDAVNTVALRARSRSRCYRCCQHSVTQSTVTLTVPQMLSAQWRSEHSHAHGATDAVSTMALRARSRLRCHWCCQHSGAQSTVTLTVPLPHYRHGWNLEEHVILCHRLTMINDVRTLHRQPPNNTLRPKNKNTLWFALLLLKIYFSRTFHLTDSL